MRAEAQIENVRPVVERVVRSHGYELFDLKLRREAIGLVLRVVIDFPVRRDANGAVEVEPLEHSIGIDDCQRVSQDLGTVLDVEDAVEGHYTLEVSSPGADRPLRSPDDYRRFVGRPAKVVVTEAVEGQMHFDGRLVALEGGEIVLEVGKKTRRIPLARVSRARLDVEFPSR